MRVDCLTNGIMLRIAAKASQFVEVEIVFPDGVFELIAHGCDFICIEVVGRVVELRNDGGGFVCRVRKVLQPVLFLYAAHDLELSFGQGE